MGKATPTTVVAIVAGTALGAWAALMARGPTQDAPAPAASDELEAVSKSPSSAARREPAAREALLRTPERAPQRPSPSGAPPAAGSIEVPDVPLPRAELGCARRVARQCLAAAEHYDPDGDAGADAEKAHTYRVMAVSILNERCSARDPEACSDVSELYAGGIGVPANAETAQALRAPTPRARRTESEASVIPSAGRRNLGACTSTPRAARSISPSQESPP
jgi:hypothetical protein